MKKLVIMGLLFLALFSVFGGDQSTSLALPDAKPYEDGEFPEWSQYLFRSVVITVGAFPLTFLLTQSVFDLGKWAIIDQGDIEKAPGIFGFLSNSTENVLTDEEKVGIITTAVGLSVSIALVDFVIELIERKKSRPSERN